MGFTCVLPHHLFEPGRLVCESKCTKKVEILTVRNRTHQATPKSTGATRPFSRATRMSGVRISGNKLTSILGLLSARNITHIMEQRSSYPSHSLQPDDSEMKPMFSGVKRCIYYQREVHDWQPTNSLEHTNTKERTKGVEQINSNRGKPRFEITGYRGGG